MGSVHGETKQAGQLPPVGEAALLQDFLFDSVGSLRVLYQRYGDIVGFWKGDGCSIFAFGPDYNREVLANQEVFYLSSGFPGPKKSAQRRFGYGLFGLNGEAHQRCRRLLMPPFRKEAVESYIDVLIDLTDQFLRHWHDGQQVDMAHEMKELALRITSKLLFGLDDLSLAHDIEGVFEEWMELNHETYFASALPIDCPNGHYERMLQVADTLEGQLLELVRQGRARGNDRRDVLTILLHARDSGFMTDAELVGQLHTLFNAAYHTTTSALTWTVFLLAQHPRVMRELLAELHGHLHGQAPTNPQLARMSLLDRVIKESMRLLPPVVYAPRVNMVPINLGPYHLPKGTMVVTSHYITHHMPELFPQPERFLPDRWLHSNPSPYAYMPFGAGPRMCIGAPFATLMLKVAVAILFQRFRLSVVPGAQIDRQCTLTLGPRDGIPMTIWRQDRQFSTSPVQGNIHDMVHFPPYEERPAAAA